MSLWGRGQLREVLGSSETTGPHSVGPYDLLIAAASRVHQANNRLVHLQAEYHRAEIEHNEARMALARMMSDYGIKSTVDGKEPGNLREDES